MYTNFYHCEFKTNVRPVQIQAAIEYPSLVGNVSISFPHYGLHNDSIRTACNTKVNQTVRIAVFTSPYMFICICIQRLHSNSV